MQAFPAALQPDGVAAAARPARDDTSRERELSPNLPSVRGGKSAVAAAARKSPTTNAETGVEEVGDTEKVANIGILDRAGSEEPADGGKGDGTWVRKGGSGGSGGGRTRKRSRLDFGEDVYEYELQLHLDALEHERKPPRPVGAESAGAGDGVVLQCESGVGRRRGREMRCFVKQRLAVPDR